MLFWSCRSLCWKWSDCSCQHFKDRNYCFQRVISFRIIRKKNFLNIDIMNYNNINQIVNHSGWITKLSTFLNNIDCLSYLHPILNLGMVAIILFSSTKNEIFLRGICTDISLFWSQKKCTKKWMLPIKTAQLDFWVCTTYPQKKTDKTMKI